MKRINIGYKYVLLAELSKYLWDKGVNLIDFQYNASCEGGVTGLIWNDDVEEYCAAQSDAFGVLQWDVPLAIRKRYADFGIPEVRKVYAVVDAFAEDMLEILYVFGIVGKCNQCDKFFNPKYGCENHYKEETDETSHRV
jgi:hypothetical protein